MVQQHRKGVMAKRWGYGLSFRAGASSAVLPGPLFRWLWRGDVVRSWHCRTCERYWPLSANEQQAFNRRTGPVDRRRATRADRRSRT